MVGTSVGCNANAMCILVSGVAQCQCNDGFSGDGLTTCQGTKIKLKMAIGIST